MCCRPVPTERKSKETKKTELDKRELKEKQKWENEYRKKFKVPILSASRTSRMCIRARFLQMLTGRSPCLCAQLNGPIEVIHMARVREDWQGGKNDLSVRQGDNVEIIRVNNNPGGKWLARDMRGNGESNALCASSSSYCDVLSISTESHVDFEFLSFQKQTQIGSVYSNDEARRSAEEVMPAL